MSVGKKKKLKMMFIKKNFQNEMKFPLITPLKALSSGSDTFSWKLTEYGNFPTVFNFHSSKQSNVDGNQVIVLRLKGAGARIE